MLEKSSTNIIINYCLECGWSISNKMIEEITGNKDPIFYCINCGVKLIKENLNQFDDFNIKTIPKKVDLNTFNQYNDNIEFDKGNIKTLIKNNKKFSKKDILNWIWLVKKFHSFITAHRFMSKYYDEEKVPSLSLMRKRLRSYLGVKQYERLLIKNKLAIKFLKNSMIPKQKQDDQYPYQFYLVYLEDLNLYKLYESQELMNNYNISTYSMSSDGISCLMPVEGFSKKICNTIIKISSRFDDILLSQNQSIYSIDDKLNIYKILAFKLKSGDRILMPRKLKVLVNDNPLDLKDCGFVCEINGKEYITFGKSKLFNIPRFIKKDFDLGFILGQYIAEGSMNIINLTCGTNKNIIMKVSEKVKKVLGIKFRLEQEKRENYKNAFKLRNESLLIKSIFTKGIGLKPALAHQKEIPPFIYNAPSDCVKGFLRGFTLGDATIKEQIRNSINMRNIKVRLYTSSPRLVFGINFLLKRFGIITNLEKIELSKKNPNWHDHYIIHIMGKRNYELLRKFVPETPMPKDKAPGKKCILYLNPWLKKVNIELKELYNYTFHSLYIKGLIGSPIHKLLYQGKNISENYLLRILTDIIKHGVTTPTLNILYSLFRHNTINLINKVKIEKMSYTSKKLITKEGNYISGLNQSYIS